MTQGIDIVFSFAVLIMSVVVHEVSHGYVANMMGDPTAKFAGRLTLNPLKHLDPIGSILVPIFTSLAGFPFGWAKPVPFNPYNLKAGKWGPAIVAAAGPLSNLFLALAFGFLLRSTLGVGAAALGPAQNFLFMIVLVNVFLGVFNLFPIAPLDGSKLLFAILPYHLRYIEDFMERNQLILVLLFIYLGGAVIQSVAFAVIKLILGAGAAF